EPAGAASMIAALKTGHPVTLANIDRFADGTAVKRAGAMTFEVVSELGLDIRPVAEGAVATEMLDMYQVDGIIAEPSGALASARSGGRASGEALTREPGSTGGCLDS